MKERERWRKRVRDRKTERKRVRDRERNRERKTYSVCMCVRESKKENPRGRKNMWSMFYSTVKVNYIVILRFGEKKHKFKLSLS